MNAKKSGLIPSMKLVRFHVWKQVILLALAAVIGMMLFMGYSAARRSTLDSFATNQMLFASQIAVEVQYRIGIIDNALRLWSLSPEMDPLESAGLESMQNLLDIHSPDLSAVTRMDEHGIILHSVPLVEGTLGADISGQPHIVSLLETRRPVFSDAFLAVQGYWGLAYHVPVLSAEGEFRGSLGVLIPFGEMIDRVFTQSMSREASCAWVLGSDGRVLYSNQATEEGRGYSELARGAGFDSIGTSAGFGWTGHLITDFSPEPEGGDSSATRMFATLLSFEVGGSRWSVVLASPLEEVLGSIAGMRDSFLLGAAGILALALLYATLRIRARVSASQARKWEGMARIQQLLKRTIDQASEFVAILDQRYRVLYANPSVERITGVGREILGRPFAEVPFDAVSPSPERILDELRRKGSWSGTVDGSGPGSRHFRLHLSISRAEDTDAGDVHYILIGRDILAQSELDRRIHEQQKMEAIGLLAGGVAHDFNNLLVGVQGHAELLERRYGGEAEILHAALVIQDAVQRGSELTRQLLGYAGKGKHKIVPVDLADSVRNVWKLLKRTLDRRIDVQLDLADGTVVMGDPAQLEQVVLNLAVNAMDAMPRGGTLRFELGRTVVPGEVLYGTAGGDPAEFAVLKAIDTGGGIAPGDIEHIFEPFFTTKQEGGTGMGLATVLGIVTNHGGWIDVESTPGEGACFVMHLPLAGSGGTPSEVETPRPPSAKSDGRGTILLVDDEPVVLDTTTELLRELGYAVVPVPGGAEALEFLGRTGGEIDVVILDLSMPGIDGGTCFREIRRTFPGLPVLLASGYSRDGRVQELIDLGADDFLQKPFRLSDLSRILRRLTGDGVSGPSRTEVPRERS